jgi:hypothetical protein
LINPPVATSSSHTVLIACVVAAVVVVVGIIAFIMFRNKKPKSANNSNDTLPTYDLPMKERTSLPQQQPQHQKQYQFAPAPVVQKEATVQQQQQPPANYQSLAPEVVVAPVVAAPVTTAPAVSKLLRVTHAYTAASEDELSLTVGTTIILVESFDDGWAVGQESISGQNGFFPMVCVEEVKINAAPVEPVKEQNAGSRLSEIKAGRRNSSRMSNYSVSNIASAVAAAVVQNVIMVEEPSVAANKKMRVLHPYEGSMEDELTLVPGDVIEMLESYDDGWALGKMGEKTGAFPLICVEEIKFDEEKLKRISKRASSAVHNSWSQNEPSNLQQFRVLHAHQPSMDDELTLVPGTIVKMVQSFDDGWALGIALSTGARGAFPLVCVEPLQDNRSSYAESVTPQTRVTSLVILDGTVIGGNVQKKGPLSQMFLQLEDNQ